MKVLYLTPGCFDKGGISRYSRYQVRALREIAGEPNVRVMSLLGPDESSFEEPFTVDFFAGGTRPAQKAEFMARAAALCATVRPDLIWSAHVNLSGFALGLARALRARTVLNTYGLEVWSGFRRDARWGLTHTEHVMSDCHFTARYLEDSGLRPRGSVEVIWDCVDVEKFFPRAPSAQVLARYGIPDPATGINLLSLGRMSKAAAHKGYDRLLEVFAKVAPKVPNLRLVYAGRGDLVDVLRARAAELGLSARVFFTGMVHEDDLADVYRCAHLFSLVCDRGVGRGEGIPLTPLEAAACGAPILVGNHDGSQEAPEQGITGYALDPFDLDAHAQIVTRLATDESLRRAMGEAARKRALEVFSYPIFREKHRSLLASRDLLR